MELRCPWRGRRCVKWGGELRFWGALWGREDGEDLPAEPALTAEGDRPHCPLTAGGGTQAGVVQEWSSGFRVLSLGHLPKHVLPFLGLFQPKVTEGSSHLAGVWGWCWQISPGAVRHPYCVFIPAWCLAHLLKEGGSLGYQNILCISSSYST